MFDRWRSSPTGPLLERPKSGEKGAKGKPLGIPVFGLTQRGAGFPPQRSVRADFCLFAPPSGGAAKAKSPPPQVTPIQRHRLPILHRRSGRTGHRIRHFDKIVPLINERGRRGTPVTGDTQGACPWENFWSLLFLYKSDSPGGETLHFEKFSTQTILINFPKVL